MSRSLAINRNFLIWQLNLFVGFKLNLSFSALLINRMKYIFGTEQLNTLTLGGLQYRLS